MMYLAQEFDSTAGDPHQQVVDAVREGGPRTLAAQLGDQAFLLTALATEPGSLFSPTDTASAAYTEVMARLFEARSALDALEARTVVALADSLTLEKKAEAMAHAAQEAEHALPSKKLLREASRAAARDVSMITRRSPASAAHSLASQRRLVEDMCEMYTALATGKVTSDVAHSAARSFAPLSSGQRADADRILGERIPHLDAAGKEDWDAEVATAIEKSDPFGQNRRHQHAKQERHVTVRRAAHGMATVSARVTALDAAKIRKRLRIEAERLRAGGDRRGHQAIQADSFVNTLLGAEHGMEPVTLDIGVMITDRTLISPGAGDVAHIEGYGTAPAEVLRDELRDIFQAVLSPAADDAMGPDGPALRAVMRRLFTHPRTGELVAVESRAREFPAALARFLRWRDQRCRGPFCDAEIRHSDHIRPHAAGGRTSLDNGQGTCAYCNDKEQQARTVTRDAGTDGHQVTWTSHTGTTRTTRPAALTRAGPGQREVGTRLREKPRDEQTTPRQAGKGLTRRQPRRQPRHRPVTGPRAAAPRNSTGRRPRRLRRPRRFR